MNVAQVRWQNAASRADEETNGVPVPAVRLSQEADRQGSDGVRGEVNDTRTSAEGEGKLNNEDHSFVCLRVVHGSENKFIQARIISSALL